MGLSSNQARFLSITARQCDLEHRMQNICHRRLRLSQDLQSAARTYDAQTSDRKLYINTLNTDSLESFGSYQVLDDGTANSVTRLNNQGYQVLDTADNQIIGTFATGSYKVVNTAAELIKAVQDKPDMNIVLGNTIDFTGSNTISGFKGTIYGNGNTITTNKAVFDTIDSGANVYDVRLQVSGMLVSDSGYLAKTNAGNIDNVLVTGSTNSSSSSNVGILTGTNNGTISNVSSTASITGGNKTGGITGTNNGFITNAIVTGNTTGGNDVGGIAGVNTTGSINKASVLGNVSGNDAGGIVGSNSGAVTSCFSSGTIGGASKNTVGGLVGSNNNSGTIADSYSVASISGTGNLGALAGVNTGSIGSSNVAILSEAGSGIQAVGNGSTSAQVIGILTQTDIDTVLKPTLTNNSWDKTNEEIPVHTSAIDVTTSSATVTQTLPLVQQPYSNMTVINNIGQLSDSNDQAMFTKLTTAYGSAINNTDLQIVRYNAAVPNGTGGYTYQPVVSLAIKTETGLKKMDEICNSADTTKRAAALSSNYVLTNDITLTGADNWTAIGGANDVKFTGMFDGNSHDINDLSIVESGTNVRYQGMFGNVGQGGSVLRTNLVNASIDITGDAVYVYPGTDATTKSGYSYPPGYVGILAGVNNGTLENCNATNLSINISGKGNQVGGLVGASGSINDKAVLNKCSTSGTITINGVGSFSQVGGLAGWQEGGELTFSSSTTNINTPNGGTAQYMAALVGDLDSKVGSNGYAMNYCYATGTLNGSPTTLAKEVNNAVIQNCYYKSGATLQVYDSTPGQTYDPAASLSDLVDDQTSVNGTNVPVWIAPGQTYNGVTNSNSYHILNTQASNTVSMSFQQISVNSVTDTPTLNATHTKNPSDYATELYNDGTTSPKTLATGVSLEEGLRSGRYRLLIESDQLNQNPVVPTNANNKTYEAVDWRTEPIIWDELYEGNDQEAQTNYDRVVRDVNEQDKLLQLEQEKVTTEYQALTSEKDAVKKILGNNAQTSFKYFS